MRTSIMQFFSYEHLPSTLQDISRPISILAEKMDAELPDNAEKIAGLRKLLEAKDCFVRAKLAKVERIVEHGTLVDLDRIP